jgi:hypothetical protein
MIGMANKFNSHGVDYNISANTKQRILRRDRMFSDVQLREFGLLNSARN